MAIIVDNINPLSGDTGQDLQMIHDYVQYLANAINEADDAKKHAAAERLRQIGVSTNG